VVAGSQEVQVRLHDGRVLNGKVIGHHSKFDIALVQVQGGGLKPARLGDSGNLRVGQWAIAIGSPFGLEKTMTVGIVSATGRSGLGQGTYGDFIQTDASINPGNSGGALLNLNGELVGINLAVVQNAQNIGFAVPANKVAKLLDGLK